MFRNYQNGAKRGSGVTLKASWETFVAQFEKKYWFWCPKSPKSSPEIPQDPKSGRKRAQNGTKSGPKRWKIEQEMQPKFRRILRTIFGVKVFNFEWFLQACTSTKHSKNWGFRRFFDFCTFLLRMRFWLDFWSIWSSKILSKSTTFCKKLIQNRSWNWLGGF